MVLGLIETVDTVMGHISSNLDASQPQVTIVGSSSMAGTGRLGVGCGHRCRCQGRGLRRPAGLCGLLCQPRAHPHTHKQGCTHLHRGAHTPAEMRTQCAHTRPQVRTRSRTGAHTPAHASVHTVRKHTGKGTHACRCAQTHRCTLTRSSKHTIGSDTPICFCKLWCPYAKSRCGGSVRSGPMGSARMRTQSYGSI